MKIPQITFAEFMAARDDMSFALQELAEAFGSNEGSSASLTAASKFGVVNKALEDYALESELNLRDKAEKYLKTYDCYIKSTPEELRSSCSERYAIAAKLVLQDQSSQ